MPSADTAPAVLAGSRLDWTATHWDDPRVAALRAAMDEEVRPRYAGLVGRLPPGPVPAEVVVTWLGLLDGTPAVTATLRRLEVEGEPLRHEVKRVFVAATHRRLGLAGRALARVEETARERAVEELHLQTGDRQPDAVALYAASGWSRVPVYRPYDQLPQSICFAKRL